MLQLEFFRDRTFTTTNAVSFFMWAALFGTLFLIAQFFQFALGRSPLEAGLDLLPWTGAPMVVAPIAGALSERYGNRPVIAAGLALDRAERRARTHPCGQGAWRARTRRCSRQRRSSHKQRDERRSPRPRRAPSARSGSKATGARRHRWRGTWQRITTV
jgi:hypothetical protein